MVAPLETVDKRRLASAAPIFPHNQYCLRYGGKHDDLAPFVVNQHRNGLLTPWSIMPPTRYRSSPSTITSIRATSLNPLRLWDCDRPVNASAADLFRVRAETGLAAFTTSSRGGSIMFGKNSS